MPLSSLLPGALQPAGTGAELYLYALDPKTSAPVASANASTRVIAASTYKLYVAYSMILAVEGGKASWADPLLPGWSLGECLEVMITESDNDCPEEWLEVADKVGFLEEPLHDAALVMDVETPLVLVILTADASWEAIAAVAELVYVDFTSTYP